MPPPAAATSINNAPAVPPPAAKPPAKAPPRSDGFQLRLSRSEIDLSRSRNVTDEQRRLLREKQLMLDADDQVAALLSLKNTVKQLEQRLNELQLKLATAPALSAMPPGKVVVPPTPPAPVTSSASTAAPPKPETSAPPPAPASAPAIQSPTPVAVPDPPATAATPAPPSAVAPTPPAPVKKPAPATPAPAVAAAPVPSLSDQMMSSLPPPWVSGGVLGALLLLIAAWFWSRSVRKSASVTARPDVTESDIAMAREIERDVPSAPNNPATSGNADFSAPALPPAEVTVPPSASG